MGTRRQSRIRALTGATLLLAVVAVGLLMFGAFDSSYEVKVRLETASGLVKGDEVKVGGVTVGTISGIDLADDGAAELTLTIDDGPTPLHDGTHAVVRSLSLSGIANRYVTLEPGPNDAREIADGGTINADDTQPEVDLDELLNTLGPATQKDLRTLTRRSSVVFDNDVRQMNAGIAALNPALTEFSRTANELNSDQGSLERFIVESAGVVTQLSQSPETLASSVNNTLGTLDAIAREDGHLDSTLAQLPATLRRTNTTLVNLRATLGDLRPAVREARPVAAPLAEALRRLRPVARDARPVIARLNRAVDRPGRGGDLLQVLQRLPALSKAAVPAFKSTDQVTQDSQPVLDDTRPYTPDLIAGVFNGFGGTTGGYYDANGHFARITAQASLASVNGVPLPSGSANLNGLNGFRTDVRKRCPGGATQRLPDGSNPFLDGRSNPPCNPDDTAK